MRKNILPARGLRTKTQIIAPRGALAAGSLRRSFPGQLSLWLQLDRPLRDRALSSVKETPHENSTVQMVPKRRVAAEFADGGSRTTRSGVRFRRQIADTSG